MIKSQQSQALTSHFENFWSIMIWSDMTFLKFLISVCISWRETSCGTTTRTPSQDLACDVFLPTNTVGANSGYCECTFGQANVVFGCADTWIYDTCEEACGYGPGNNL